MRIEFAAVLEKAKLNVPPELRSGALASYTEIRRLTPLLRIGLPVEAEPAITFDLQAILRTANET